MYVRKQIRWPISLDPYIQVADLQDLDIWVCANLAPAIEAIWGESQQAKDLFLPL